MTTESMPNKNTPTGPEQPAAIESEKTPKDRVEDFAKLATTQDRVDRISDVLADSAELEKAHQQIEFEIAGGESSLKEKASYSLPEKIKIWWAGGRESATGKQIEFRKIAEIAHQEVDKKMGVIEQTDGQQLKGRKAGLAAHEKNSDADLKNLESLGIHSKNEITDIKVKLIGEREGLKQDVEARKNDLELKLAGYSETAIEKQKKLGECAVEYKGYHDNIVREITTVRGNIAKYERGLASLKLEGDTAETYKEKIRQAINEQKGILAKIEVSEETLKQRLESVKANKREVDAYLDRINNIGKTDAEIRAEKAEKQRKESEARGAVRAPGGGAASAAVEGGGGRMAKPGTSHNDLTDDEIAIADRIAAEQQINRQLINKTDQAANELSEARKRSRPEAVASAAEAATHGQEPQQGRRAERREKPMEVGYWLDRIFKVELKDRADKIMRQHFNIKSSNFTVPMTISQALSAYTGYLKELKGCDIVKAKKLAREHFIKVFGNESEVNDAAVLAEKKSADATKQTEVVLPVADATAVARPTAETRSVNQQARAGVFAPEQGEGEAESGEEKKQLDKLEQAMDEDTNKPNRGLGHDADRTAEPEAGEKAKVEARPDNDVAAPSAEGGQEKERTTIQVKDILAAVDLTLNGADVGLINIVKEGLTPAGGKFKKTNKFTEAEALGRYLGIYKKLYPGANNQQITMAEQSAKEKISELLKKK